MKSYKKILPYVIYCLAMLFAAVGEVFLDGHYFSLGLLMALAHKRKNMLIIMPSYAICVALAQWRIEGLLYAILPVAVLLSSQLIFYRLKKSPQSLYYNLATLILSLSSFLFITYDVWSIVRGALSVVSSVLTYNVVSVGMTAIETRGVKWKLSSVEWLSVVLMLVILISAVAPISVVGFSLLPIVASVIISLSIASGPPICLVTGGLVGLSAGVILQDFSLPSVYLAYAIGVVLGRARLALSSLLGTALFIGMDYLVSRELGYLEWIGCGAGSLITLALYRVLSPRFRNISVAQTRTQSNRLLINRTRQEVADKLTCLASVFKDMENVLTTTGECQSLVTPDKITSAVQAENCTVCPKRRVCESSLGGATTALLTDMVRSAIERGKASILDTPPFLSANCSRLTNLIESVNCLVEEGEVKKNRNAQNQLLRDMMSRQMGGVGEILEELSQDVSMPISYDASSEKKLITELNYRNYLATDAIVISNASSIALTLQLAEEPEDEIDLKATINRVLGARMTESRRENNVLGGVTIVYESRPKYNVTYGEYSLAMDKQSPCGDSVEATHISKNRVMIILSDGMGSGRTAYDTSRLAIELLTSFYKAGFSHNTVMYSSSRLLTLKSEEDFNAVDLALVDLTDGAVDFIKLGGREGYVKSISGVDVVPCGSLPLGIVDEIVPVVTRRVLTDGDYFVLVSDGVADIIDREEMQTMLTTMATTNPNVIAKEIVQSAVRLGGRRDDMSCVVGRVFLSI